MAEPVASEVVQRIGDSYVGWQENSFPGLLGNVAAGRIANRLDLGGTNCVVDAACASSLGAVHLAMMELAAGRCDVALSGGLDTFNDIFMYMCFSKTPALSPSGDCPAVLVERRRHRAGGGAGRADAEAARRRPPRRRPDLRRHQGGRLLQRRQGERRLRPQLRRPGQVPPPGLRGRPAISPRDGRARRGPRHRHQGRRRRRARPWPRSSARPEGRGGPGAPWARSSRRSATPRPRPAPRA